MICSALQYAYHAPPSRTWRSKLFCQECWISGEDKKERTGSKNAVGIFGPGYRPNTWLLTEGWLTDRAVSSCFAFILLRNSVYRYLRSDWRLLFLLWGSPMRDRTDVHLELQCHRIAYSFKVGNLSDLNRIRSVIHLCDTYTHAYPYVTCTHLASLFSTDRRRMLARPPGTAIAGIVSSFWITLFRFLEVLHSWLYWDVSWTVRPILSRHYVAPSLRGKG